MTGATGFLGRAVLSELLTETDAAVICLVRAATTTEAQDRGQQTLRVALGREPSPAEQARVSWLRSDLEQPRLGLDSADWQALASKTGDVMHCAASVRFDLELSDAHRINVEGTISMLALARTAAGQGHFGCFHHVSTAYVAGARSGPSNADFLPDDDPTHFRNTYERTKARAERLLRAQADVAVSIYRPSMIGGRTDTGETDNWTVFYLPMRLMTRGQLPVLSVGGDQLLDMVGVDYVARGIVSFAGRDRNGFVGHHLTAGTDPVTVEQLASTTNEIAYRFNHQPSSPRMVSPTGWKALSCAISLAARAPKRLKGVRRWGRLGQLGMRSFVPYVPYTCVRSRFDDHRERADLAQVGIVMPDAAEYLTTMATYAVRVDFGRNPSVARQPSELQDL